MTERELKILKDIAVTLFTREKRAVVPLGERRREERMRGDLMRQRDHSLLSELASITGTSCLSTQPGFFSRRGCLLSCLIKGTRTPSPTRGSRGFYAVDRLHENIFRKQAGESARFTHAWDAIDPPTVFQLLPNLWNLVTKMTRKEPLMFQQTNSPILTGLFFFFLPR